MRLTLDGTHIIHDDDGGHVHLTRHAWERMCARGVAPRTLCLVLRWGRIARVRNAAIYAVGRKEMEKARAEGVDLSQAKNVHVVCARDGWVLTVYRNKDFRDLRMCKFRDYRVY